MGERSGLEVRIWLCEAVVKHEITQGEASAEKIAKVGVLGILQQWEFWGREGRITEVGSWLSRKKTPAKCGIMEAQRKKAYKSFKC